MPLVRRIRLAFRAFFVALFYPETATQIEEALGRRELPAPQEVLRPVPVAKPKAVRSEAITLLATLQREARFVDFLQEPLGDYSDAQVGAVARDVHRGCAAALERMFALKPLSNDCEGATIELPAGFDAGRYRLVGNVVGEPPFRGQLVHHGWEAARCELPAWSGSEEAVRVVAPSEIELK